MANEMRDCTDLLMRIFELEFAGVELNLYLDTHPTDATAIEHINRVHKEMMDLHMEFDRRCGPLLGFGHSMNTGNTWLWATQPWPWEM